MKSFMCLIENILTESSNKVWYVIELENSDKYIFFKKEEDAKSALKSLQRFEPESSYEAYNNAIETLSHAEYTKRFKDIASTIQYVLNNNNYSYIASESANREAGHSIYEYVKQGLVKIVGITNIYGPFLPASTIGYQNILEGRQPADPNKQVAARVLYDQDNNVLNIEFWKDGEWRNDIDPSEADHNISVVSFNDLITRYGKHNSDGTYYDVYLPTIRKARNIFNKLHSENQ